MKIRSNKKEIIIGLLPYILSALSMAIGLVTSYFLARTLGASLYGEIRYIVSLFSLFSSILLFGLSNFILREAKNQKRKATILNHSINFLFVISSFAIPIIFYILKVYLNVSNTTYAICIIISSFSMALSSIYGSYNQGIGDYHITQLITNIIPRLTILLLAIASYFLLDYSWFVSNYILIYTAIYGTIGIYILIKHYRSFELGFSKKDYLSLCFFFGTTITYTITSEITNIIQGTFFSNKTVLGIIGVSTQILSLLSIFTTVIASITAPLYSKYKRENNLNGIIDMYELNLRITSYIAIPFYLFLITQSSKFLYFFGESYQVYPFILAFCAIGSAASTLTGQTGTILLMTGKEKIEVLNGIIGIITYVIFVFIFINDKIYGLTMANMFSSIAINIAKIIEIGIIYKRNPMSLKTLLTIILITVIDFVCIFFLKFISNWIIWLIIGIAVGLATIVINFLISPYRKDFKNLIYLRREFKDE